MMGDIERMAGKWVADADMNPATNVWGRRFYSEECEGVFRGDWPTKNGLPPRGLWWHFTPLQCRLSGADE